MASRTLCLLLRARPRTVVLVALVLALPSLAVGFFADDWLFIDALEHRFAWNAPFWDLYRFPPGPPWAVESWIANGRLPWWTAPGLFVHLLRPLSSVLFAFDHALFGRHDWLWHVHALLWYAALLLAASALFRTLFSRESAILALWLFGLSDATAFPVAWLAARNSLIATTFVAVGLTAHVRARRDGFRAGQWLAPCAFAFALLAGEAGLAGLGFALAYDMRAAAAPRSLRVRIAKALPLLMLGIAYTALYAMSGAGARNGSGYVSPLSDPSAFSTAAAQRIPLMFGDAVLGIAPELANTGSAAPFVLVGLVSVGLVAWLWRAVGREVPERESAELRWLLPGALVALVIASGGYPGARALLVANLAFAPLLSLMIRHAASAGAGVARRTVAGTLLFAHVAFSPLSQVSTYWLAWSMARQSEEIARSVARQAAGARRLLIVAASDPMAADYPGAVLLSMSDGSHPCWGRLSAARADIVLTRTAMTSFSLEPAGTTFVRAPFETLYRSRSVPFSVGDEHDVCGARVRVAALRDGLPSRIEITDDSALEHSSAAWFAWRDGAMQRLRFPAIGQRLTIPWSPGPSRMY